MKRLYCLALLATGCAVNLEPGAGLVSCSTEADCPSAYTCILASGFCAPLTSPCIQQDGGVFSARANGESCTAETQLGVCNSGFCSVCGNRVVEPGETCDDGDDDNLDECTQRCNAPRCGDGFLKPGEACDDGNEARDDGCLPTCVVNTCGDGAVDPATETCDDANANENDGCSQCRLTKWRAEALGAFGTISRSGTHLLSSAGPISADGAGGFYIAERIYNTIWRYDAKADVFAAVVGGGAGLVAGGSVQPAVDVAEDTVARYVAFRAIRAMAVRSNGQLYFGSTFGSGTEPAFTVGAHGSEQPVVMRVDANGRLHRVAGTGVKCAAPPCVALADARSASLQEVTALAFHPDGSLYIGDFRSLLRLDLRTETLQRVAGSGAECVIADGCGEDGPAIDARLSRIGGIAFDADGSVLLTDTLAPRLLRIDAETGVIRRLPSNGLSLPGVVVRDANGALFVTDTDTRRVMTRAPGASNLAVFAGNGVSCTLSGACGDGGMAVDASLTTPNGLAITTDGSVVIADYNVGRIRTVRGGVIASTIGNAEYDNVLDGLATTSLAGNIAGTDPQGRLLFTSQLGAQVGRADPSTYILEHMGGRIFASCSAYSPCDDGGDARKAGFGTIVDIAGDTLGNVYVLAASPHRIRRIDNNRIVTAFAGNPTVVCDGSISCGGGTTLPTLVYASPADIEIAGSTMYIAEARGVIRAIALPDGPITHVAGTGIPGRSSDSVPATSAQFRCITDLTIRDGALIVSDRNNCRVLRIEAGRVTTLVEDAGCVTEDNCASLASGSIVPQSASYDAQGRLNVASGGNLLRYSDGQQTVLLGGAGPTYGVTAQGATSPGTAGQVTPLGDGRVVVNAAFGRTTEIGTDGIVRAITGRIDSGSSGLTMSSDLLRPGRIARVSDGLLITDGAFVKRVRNGVLDVVAGIPSGFSGAQAFLARYRAPMISADAIAYDSARARAYVMSARDNSMVVITASGDARSWTSEPRAAATALGFVDGALEVARFDGVRGLAYDARADRLFVADSGNHVIRQIGADGLVGTFAGVPRTAGFAGDGGLARDALLTEPSAVAVADDGSVYIADTGNNRVRRVETDGTVATVLTREDAPVGLRFDNFGNLWVTGGRMVSVMTGDVNTPPDAMSPVVDAYVSSPSEAFPSSIAACLTDVETGEDDASMLVLDSCAGMILRLERF